MFGVRQAGEQGFYSLERDFLMVFPDAITKGAVMAATPGSMPFEWLVKRKQGMSVQNLRKLIRDVLEGMLKMMKARKAFKEAVEEADLDAEVYQAIVMGAGCVMIPSYMTLVKNHKVRSLKSGMLSEPHLDYDVTGFLLDYDMTVLKARK